MTFGLTILIAAIVLLLLLYRLWWRWLIKRCPTPVPIVRVYPSDLEQLEQSIGGGLPAILKSAYLDGEILRFDLPIVFRRQGLEYAVAEFFRADAAVNKRVVEWSRMPQDAFVFAGDDFGNYYFVRANDDAVYFCEHEGGECTKDFDSFEQLWNALQSEQ